MWIEESFYIFASKLKFIGSNGLISLGCNFSFLSL